MGNLFQSCRMKERNVGDIKVDLWEVGYGDGIRLNWLWIVSSGGLLHYQC
jgi:hypothetical protein